MWVFLSVCLSSHIRDISCRVSAWWSDTDVHTYEYGSLSVLDWSIFMDVHAFRVVWAASMKASHSRLSKGLLHVLVSECVPWELIVSQIKDCHPSPSSLMARLNCCQ